MESTENEVLMDEVAEERPAEKKRSYLGSIIFLIVVAAIAAAAWYFQSMWMPQVKQTYQQAQTMMHDFMSPEIIDPMAAPAMSSTAPEVITSAVMDDEKQDVGLNEVASEVELQEENAEIVISAEIDAAKDTVIEVVARESQEPAINVDEPAIEMHSEPVIEAAASNDELNAISVEPNVTEEEVVVVTENPKSLDVPMELSIPVVNQDVGVVKPDAELAAARQAFWQRDLPKAEALYKEQINNFKANANSWGELGNLYYLQAKWQQAAIAYTEAALILLDKGDFPQAMYLRYIITGLDPVQVKRIDERVRDLQAPLKG